MNVKKVILAFLLAPWPLALIYIFLFSLFGLLAAGIIAAIIVLLISYFNLIIFALPLYLILNKYNLWKIKYVLLIALIIGVIEGMLFSIDNDKLMGIFFAINSFVVTYLLMLFLKKFD